MPYITVNTEIDVEDFIYPAFDRRIILKALQDGGYIPEIMKINNDGYLELSETGGTGVIAETIMKNFWKLTSEEQEIINAIVDKYKNL